MSTSESITHQAAAEFFHTSLLSRQSASSRIVMQGGQAAKTIETLHSMLCETLLKDSRLARTRKLENFPKMSTILADKDGAFQITLGRGLPAESFRASFLGWLAFLRSEGVIEILPALESRGGEIVCNDYLVLQEDKEQDLQLDSFKNESLKTSIDAAGAWLSSFAWSHGVADDLMEKKDPTFVRLLPYYQMLEAMRSDWHAPKDTSQAGFADQIKGKAELLGKIYNALLGSEKLKFQTKLSGVKKLGDRFPFAWPGSSNAMNDLVAFHDRVRLVFARDVIMSEKVPGTKPDTKSQFHHANVTAEAFQTAYQSYLKSPDVTPSPSLAHKMGAGLLQQHAHLFSQKEDALRAEPGVLFARNAIVFMLMHSEAVVDHQKEKEKIQFYQAVELYVQKLASANPPYVDLNVFVRLDKNVVKNENLKKRMIDALRSHQNVKSLEIQDNPTFGHSKLIYLAFHTSQLESMCARSYKAARENKDYNLHMNLERIYGCVQDPSRLQPLVRPDTYGRFLQIRQDFFVSQMPFFKRLFWKLFSFARKIDPEQIKDFMKTAMRTEVHKAASIKEKELRTAARKEQERMAKRAVDGSGPHETEPGEIQEHVLELESTSSSGPSTAPRATSGGRPDPFTEARERSQADPFSKGATQSRSSERPDFKMPESSTRTEAGRAESSPGVDVSRSSSRSDSTMDRQTTVTRESGSPAGVEVRRENPAASGEPRRAETAAAERRPEERKEERRDEKREEGTRSEEVASGETGRSSSRLSLEELSAKADRPQVDPDHVQFLKDRPKGSAPQGPQQPQVPEWEIQVIKAGHKVGLDLTERRRLERKKEKEQKKRERHALAVQKLEEHKRKMAAKKKAPRPQQPVPAAAAHAPGTPKHLVIIEVPEKFCAPGKPGRIQFQKKFFKSESFRKEMADFYRKESISASSPEDKKYFAYLISAMEQNYNHYLK